LARDVDAPLLEAAAFVLQVDQRHVVGNPQPIAQIVAHLHANARLQGRLGRSLGCPAVRLSVARPLIDSLRGGTMVFAYYPDKDWLARSRLLEPDCGGVS